MAVGVVVVGGAMDVWLARPPSFFISGNREQSIIVITTI